MNKNTRAYWIATVSKEHVERGKLGGFAQVCHGKKTPLQRMHAGDVLIYYSPQLIFGEKKPYQGFTAFGIIRDRPPYQVEMTPGFTPYRRDINYLQTTDAAIRPLIQHLDFIKDKIKWGYIFRFGMIPINLVDCMRIARAMQLEDKIYHELFI